MQLRRIESTTAGSSIPRNSFLRNPPHNRSLSIIMPQDCSVSLHRWTFSHAPQQQPALSQRPDRRVRMTTTPSTHLPAFVSVPVGGKPDDRPGWLIISNAARRGSSAADSGALEIPPGGPFAFACGSLLPPTNLRWPRRCQKRKRRYP
jgi:hypothetical protein